MAETLTFPSWERISLSHTKPHLLRPSDTAVFHFHATKNLFNFHFIGLLPYLYIILKIQIIHLHPCIYFIKFPRSQAPNIIIVYIWLFAFKFLWCKSIIKIETPISPFIKNIWQTQFHEIKFDKIFQITSLSNCPSLLWHVDQLYQSFKPTA